jgi:hypothetical protein
VDYLARRAPYVRAHKDDIGEVLADQADVVRSVWEQSGGSLNAAAVFDTLRWDRALGDRLYVRIRVTAVDFATATADELSSRRAQFDSSALDPFLLSTSRLSAESINAATFDGVQEALVAEEPDAALEAVFGVLLGAALDRYARSTVATSANFGMTSAAEQSGQRSKVWVVNSRNPRSSHASLSGEATGIGEPFSNGMQWPGDPAGGADENANCRCSVDFEE